MDARKGCILLGEGDTAYGKNLPDGLTNITVSNVTCNRGNAIDVPGYLKDSVIRNVCNRRANGTILKCKRPNGLYHVTLEHVHCSGEEIVYPV
jgi:hypothetical protein